MLVFIVELSCKSGSPKKLARTSMQVSTASWSVMGAEICWLMYSRAPISGVINEWHSWLGPIDMLSTNMLALYLSARVCASSYVIPKIDLSNCKMSVCSATILKAESCSLITISLHNWTKKATLCSCCCNWDHLTRSALTRFTWKISHSLRYYLLRFIKWA